MDGPAAVVTGDLQNTGVLKPPAMARMDNAHGDTRSDLESVLPSVQSSPPGSPRGAGANIADLRKERGPPPRLPTPQNETAGAAGLSR